MAQNFNEFRSDNASHHVFAFMRGEIALQPEKSTAPPKVVAMGFAPDEGGGHFVPNFGFRRSPNLKPNTIRAETKISFLPKEKETGF
jgi:hypothetical protein